MKFSLARILGLTALALLVSDPGANAQLTVPRIEAGVQFVELKLPNPIGEHAPGIGARFAYNLSNYFGLDAEVNHFPGGSKLNSNFGESQGLFGLKAGYGGSYGGIYAKVRPGFMHFARDSATVGRGLKNQDYFAVDLGVVAERYWRNHTYLRFDAGDTIISYGGERYINLTGTPVILNARHNPQFSIGVGLHF
jgi:outer membrane protein with beta-barrel domain